MALIAAPRWTTTYRQVLLDDHDDEDRPSFLYYLAGLADELLCSLRRPDPLLSCPRVFQQYITDKSPNDGSYTKEFHPLPLNAIAITASMFTDDIPVEDAHLFTYTRWEEKNPDADFFSLHSMFTPKQSRSCVVTAFTMLQGTLTFNILNISKGNTWRCQHPHCRCKTEKCTYIETAKTIPESQLPRTTLSDSEFRVLSIEKRWGHEQDYHLYTLDIHKYHVQQGAYTFHVVYYPTKKNWNCWACQLEEKCVHVAHMKDFHEVLPRDDDSLERKQLQWDFMDMGIHHTLKDWKRSAAEANLHATTTDGYFDSDASHFSSVSIEPFRTEHRIDIFDNSIRSGATIPFPLFRGPSTEEVD